MCSIPEILRSTVVHDNIFEFLFLSREAVEISDNPKSDIELVELIEYKKKPENLSKPIVATEISRSKVKLCIYKHK